ncbi:MAG: hypothetical protein JO065_14295 [Acidobacteria bacterium]|nr:hypothetical protein [Acidobacteriota bacterium]MBV9435129.1 hypothetical protein [Acidobacteriota bacterium]
MITTKKLEQLYATMLLLRSMERQPRRKSHDWSGYSQACIAGCIVDLMQGDTIAVSSQAGWLQSLSMPRLHLAGESSAALNVLEHRNHSESLLLATGAAFATRNLRSGGVVIAFAGAQAAKPARRGFEFAFARRLPVIYVVNAGSAARKPLARRKTSTMPPLIPVDQNDVIAVYRVASEAIAKARRGVGPTIIQTLRPPTRRADANSSSPSDGIQYLEWYLRRKGVWSEEFKKSVLEKIAAAPTSLRNEVGESG